MRHSPGPWVKCGKNSIRNNESYKQICDVKSVTSYCGPKSRTEVDANIALIASAPELLEAIEKVIREIGPLLDTSKPEAILIVNYLQFVAAKAKGEL